MKIVRHYGYHEKCNGEITVFSNHVRVAPCRHLDKERLIKFGLLENE